MKEMKVFQHFVQANCNDDQHTAQLMSSNEQLMTGNAYWWL